MEVATSIVIYIALALVCYVMAKNRGRNEALGVAAGLIFGIFAVIYYWIVGDTYAERDRKAIKRARELDELGKVSKMK